ncbi:MULTISPECIES: ATP-binding protein [unclassified Enterococcus]|uniref:tRNA lysidine(34) synthetase n=1 Tax=unclassified Enterococcus TaxID=2608891 RepID=UPI0015548CA9|nr:MULTISPECIES: ATP-binding protein [unclassified Enterococcus]MBS7576488.1 hypothetical protein [Enterococcus sp. MMGLQ5-2]MBS7583720.1 hypothetical protein [Enterococcus sp. MMGLQ5-1]NPD11581.1 ATPase [Enterococcus sp. MMGLQ5-1]NPD36325.1 ATPase [Enterococcus sp. MMGLQ5-2]
MLEQNQSKQLIVERSIIKTYRKTIWSQFVRAINDFNLLKPDDKVAVCISGGKDSMLMAKCFQELKKHGKIPFDLVFVVMDPGYNPLNLDVIKQNALELGIPITIFETNIFDYVYQLEQGSPCYLCAKMRRGHLYAQAKSLGCNKIALGHHYDDVLETILLNLFYAGEVKTMMPKLSSKNYAGVELIRPMYYIREQHIKNWRDANCLSFINCACRFTETVGCGLNANHPNQKKSKRAEMKALLAELSKDNPYLEQSLFKSMSNINLESVLGYKKAGQAYSFLDE